MDNDEPELHIRSWREVLSPDYAKLLPAAELERATKFYRKADSQRFIAARLLLRCRLSRDFPSIKPRDWELGLHAHGKPYLKAMPFPLPSSWPNYHFNLAHSGDYVALAFSTKFSVGVDIEHRRPVSDLLGIATMLYSEEEQDILRGLGDVEEVEREFFRLWTSYEALSKLEETGLLARPTDCAAFCKRQGRFFAGQAFEKIAAEYYWALCWRV